MCFAPCPILEGRAPRHHSQEMHRFSSGTVPMDHGRALLANRLPLHSSRLSANETIPCPRPAADCDTRAIRASYRPLPPFSLPRARCPSLSTLQRPASVMKEATDHHFRFTGRLLRWTNGKARHTHVAFVMLHAQSFTFAESFAESAVLSNGRVFPLMHSVTNSTRFSQYLRR
jgi:hypothetical protein